MTNSKYLRPISLCLGTGLLLVFWLAAPSVQALEVLDSQGTSVMIDSTERIVSLNGSTTEALFALGLGQHVVGRDTSSYYPPETEAIPTVGYQFQLNAEGIMALRPTLVIGQEDVKPPQMIDQLRSAKVPVLLLKNATSCQDAQQNIRMIGHAVGRDKAADELIQTMENDLQQLATHRAQQVSALKSVMLLYTRGGRTNFVLGPGSGAFGMLDLVGIHNAAGDLKGAKPITAEALIAGRPEVFVLFQKGLDSIGGEQALLEIPGVAYTPAGKQKRWVIMDDLYLGGYGPRCGKAALDLFEGIYRSEGIHTVMGE